MTTNFGMLWVVVKFDDAQQRLVELVDNGYLAEAIGLFQTFNGFIDQVKSFVQNCGGSLPLAINSRIIMTVPTSVGEELPNLVADFKEKLNNKAGVGVGLDLSEASKAANKSIRSGDIEFFDPGKTDNEDYYTVLKDENISRRFSDNVVLPPNLFDPTVPDDSEIKRLDPAKREVNRMSMEEEAQAESKYLQILSQQMGGGEQPEVAGQPQSPSQQMPTRDLLESLHGQPIEGHDPQMQQPEAEGVPAEGDETEKGQAVDELESEVDAAEKEASSTNDKLATMLHNVKSQIPQLMALADKNPQAFKQSMALIQKLVGMAHSRDKETKKSEYREAIDDLEKALDRRFRAIKGAPKQHLPLNSRKGKYKKVLVNGKEVWRQMSAGQVMDEQGQAISVKAHNSEADGE